MFPPCAFIEHTEYPIKVEGRDDTTTWLRQENPNSSRSADLIVVPDVFLLRVIDALTEIAKTKDLLPESQAERSMFDLGGDESPRVPTPPAEPKRVPAVLGFPAATTFAVRMCNTFIGPTCDEHDSMAWYDGEHICVDVVGNKHVAIRHAQFSEHDLRAMLALLEASK